jgi:hypothetical protein
VDGAKAVTDPTGKVDASPTTMASDSGETELGSSLGNDTERTTFSIALRSTSDACLPNHTADANQPPPSMTERKRGVGSAPPT